MKKERDLEFVFRKFDLDQSGTIDLQELLSMFHQFGI